MLVSVWDGLFLGAMLVSGRVHLQTFFFSHCYLIVFFGVYLFQYFQSLMAEILHEMIRTGLSSSRWLSVAHDRIRWMILSSFFYLNHDELFNFL